MSTDFAEKEREFLATLEADTGRTLGAWMEAIAAQNLSDKNEIIDWLRQQGFMFSKASWLERIHENGGKPIYDDGAAATTPPVSGPAAPVEPLPRPVPPAATPVVAPSPAPGTDSPLDSLLAKAKALQPLARHLLREITKVVPGASFTPATNHISIATRKEFAVLTIAAKELRLGLAIPGEAPAAPFTAARFLAPAYRISPAITHMMPLTDARQVNAALMAAITKATALAGE